MIIKTICQTPLNLNFEIFARRGRDILQPPKLIIYASRLRISNLEFARVCVVVTERVPEIRVSGTHYGYGASAVNYCLLFRTFIPQITMI